MAKAGPDITVHVLDMPEVKAFVAEVQTELEHLRKVEAAARRVVQLVAHGVTELNVGAAIRDLREVLDERGGGG